MRETESPDQRSAFVRKVWISVSILSIFVAVIWLISATFNVLLMILAATLIALFFHGFAALIRRNTNLNDSWSMALSIAATFIFLGLLFWLIGAKIQSQAEELSSEFPTMAEQAKSELGKYPLGRKILEQSSGKDARKLADTGKQLFRSTFGVLGDLYVIIFLGIFFTADPGIYKKGVIALIPPPGKNEARRVLGELGEKLKNWLKGKLISMAVVAVLTGIGLSILGVPLVFTLSLIAGILNFIPNFGPIIAMVPAVLVGLSQGVNTALTIAGLYIIIQMLESNVLTPAIQKKLVSIPPAMIIVGQLVVGQLTGYLGIILATPVVLIIMVLIQEMYVKKQR